MLALAAHCYAFEGLGEVLDDYSWCCVKAFVMWDGDGGINYTKNAAYLNVGQVTGNPQSLVLNSSLFSNNLYFINYLAGAVFAVLQPLPLTIKPSGVSVAGRQSRRSHTKPARFTVSAAAEWC